MKEQGPIKETRGPFLALLFAVGTCVFLASAGPAQTARESVDPFYLKLLEEGKFFYQSGNMPGAIEDLEIAFFGFLDDAPRLSECYVYLTVCHYREKHYDKARYYIDEIKRLNLQDSFASLSPPLPEDLLSKYRDAVSKLGR